MKSRDPIVTADYGGHSSHGVNLTGRKAGKRVVAAKKGMGFAAAQRSIAKRQGVGMERAGAILAAGARKAGPKAVKANPNLKKVSGVGPKKKRGK